MLKYQQIGSLLSCDKRLGIISMEGGKLELVELLETRTSIWGHSVSPAQLLCFIMYFVTFSFVV